MMNLHFSHTPKETYLSSVLEMAKYILFGHLDGLDRFYCIEKRVHLFLFSTEGDKLPLNKF